MRNSATIFMTLVLLAIFLTACGLVGGGGDNQGSEAVSTGVPPTPTNTATPTPTLPATFTPVAMGHSGHLYNVGGTRTVHIVQRGDTLGELAKQYGITVSVLAEANRISNSNLIEVGQVLYIPPCE